MPGGDRTGPEGIGPMTGRAAGYCAGYSTPGFASQPRPRGFFRRRGFRGRGLARPGQGFSNFFSQARAAGNELDDLKSQAQYLSEGLNEISQRISQLEKEEK